MEDSRTLDDLFMEYRRGQMSKQKLEVLIFFAVREQVYRFKPEGMNHETSNDFISWLYPRISRAIDRYREQGSSFDHYINAMTRLSAREYCLRQKDRKIIEQAWWDVKAEEMISCAEEEPEYVERTKGFREVRNPKQVLTLLLKSYHYLSDDYLARAAPAIGMDREKLKNMVDTLRNQRLAKEEEIRNLRERVYCQFYRCIAFEKRMLAFPPESGRRLQMKRNLEGARKRLLSMRKHLASMRIEAPNWQIANIIGVPKGTVDSNLHSVKKNVVKKAENGRGGAAGVKIK
jgi:DNA-directed RNA polymerase specialized sigma24 family protein